MVAWTPPSFRYYRESDGTFTILDEKGNTVPSPPTMKYVPANGDSKMLDPWGNEVPEYVPKYPSEFFVHQAADGTLTAVDEHGALLPFQPDIRRIVNGGEQILVVLPDGTVYEAPAYVFPEEFFIHTAADGSMTAVDSSGVPLPFQPDIRRIVNGGEQILVVLPDGTVYEAPAYVFPEEFFIHTAADGSMTAVDSSGVPLPIQPTMGHGGPEMVAESDYVVLPDGTVYEAPAYVFPEEFFIHTAADGSMTAVDSSGVPLPIQPTMGHGGPEMVAESDYVVLPDGTVYEAPAYVFPEEFFIHTAADGSMTAVDSSGVPLPIQPTMGHSVGGDGPDFAVLPDGTKYIAPPLYPPAGEPPEVWPPADWETGADGAPTSTEVESDDSNGIEVVADQGPDSGSADPIDVSDGAAEDPRTPIDVERQSDVAAEEATAPTDDARPGIEAADEGSLDRYTSDLLTVGLVETPTAADVSVFLDVSAPGDDLASETREPIPAVVDPVGDGVVSATPIPLPGGEMPVGDDVVSATPIPLPGGEMPVGDDVVSVLPVPIPGGEMPVAVDVVSATPIPLPGGEMPVGDDVVSVLPVPIPGGEMPVGGRQPELDRTGDDEIALDRKGGDIPLDIQSDVAQSWDATEFHVEVIEEVQIEEVRLEDVELESGGWDEPIAEHEDLALEDDDIDALDG